MSNWYVYIVRCRDGSLYTGITTDVARRLEEHQANRGAKYLRGRNPLALVFKQRFDTRGQALRVERHIKGLSRRKKEKLIINGTGLSKLLAE